MKRRWHGASKGMLGSRRPRRGIWPCGVSALQQSCNLDRRCHGKAPYDQHSVLGEWLLEVARPAASIQPTHSGRPLDTGDKA